MGDFRLLVDKSVVITGAGSGVGRAAAILFAQHGARLVCADVREDWARQTVDLIQNAGQAVAQPCDVRRESDVKAAIDRAVREFGRLDVMYNNAGVTVPKDGRSRAFVDHCDDDLNPLLDVNLRGVTYGCQAALRQFLEQGGGGAIVNTSSAAGLVGWGGVFYGATKGAVNQMTRGLAIEAAKHGIRVNSICPGSIITNLGKPADAPFEPASEELKARHGKMHPLGKLITPEDAANAALFLASDLSSAITGVLLPVDGGYTAG